MNRPRPIGWSVVLAALLVDAAGLGAANDAPRVTGLRVQQVGKLTYFHVSIARPRNMRVPVFSVDQVGTEAYKRGLATLPTLVPQDAKTSLVYLLPVTTPGASGFSKTTLDFVGRVHGTDEARFRLFYPVDRATTPATKKDGTSVKPRTGGQIEKTPLAGDKNQPKAGDASPARSESVDLALNFAEAKTALLPETGRETTSATTSLDRNDLRRLWAAGQASRFAVLEALAPDFGLYPFARIVTGRKYRVAAPPLVPRATPRLEENRRRLFETMTGGLTVAANVQLQRLLGPASPEDIDRAVPIARIAGVGAIDHPWHQMMAGKKPADEPLARFVPHDQYYVHFKSVSAFLDFLDLFEEWGNTMTRSYEINSRNYNIRDRYDRQLCVGSRGAARGLAALFISDLAITGSDLHFRDGTDLTYVFRAANRKFLLKSLDPYIDRARKEFAAKLQEAKTTYRDIAVESYVSPRREISLHRAFVKEDILIYSNSPVALRRTLDAYLGHAKAMADSTDFQYARTVFRHDDREEDGFFYLSSAFVRQMLGPASKIKHKRRLEALTSLYMAGHAALFNAWEKNGLPADVRQLLAASALRPEEVYVPEGRPIAWDAAQKVAISDFYNTVHFATPLIELPIDGVTRGEEEDYKKFREDYHLRFGDLYGPMGARFHVGRTEVRIDTLVPSPRNNSWYDALRTWTGGGLIALRPVTISSTALLQYRSYLNAALFDEPPAKDHPSSVRKSALGRWVSLEIDDSSLFNDIVSLLIRQQLEAQPRPELSQSAARLATGLPITIGLGIRDREAFRKQLDDYDDIFQWLIGPFTVERKGRAHAGVPITVVRFAPHSRLAAWLGVNSVSATGKSFEPVLYHAFAGDGWFLSLDESRLRRLIDHSIARQKPIKPPATYLVSSSLHVSPASAVEAHAALRTYLEWESHRRALANGLEWYALYRCGLVDSKMDERKKFDVAVHYLGYGPESPEKSPYKYNVSTDDVENGRHGSFRRPILHFDLAPGSSVSELLDQIRNFRIDVRLGKDGIQTTVTMTRKPR